MKKKFNSLPNDNFLDVKCCLNNDFCFGYGRNTLVEKEKMLVTNIFSFSDSVFLKRVFSQGH